MSEPYHAPSANDVLFGAAGAPALQWAHPVTKQDFPVGTSYEGEIVKLDATQQRNIQDKSKVDTWPDGKPKMIALVTIQTTLRDPAIDEDDGQRTLWVSGKYLSNAVKDAVRKSGAHNLDLGGYLKVTLTGYGEAQQGFRPPRLFDVAYRKPDPNRAAALAANAALAADPWATQEAANGAPLSGPWSPEQVQAATRPPAPAASPAQGSSGQGMATPAQPATTQATSSVIDLSGVDERSRALIERMLAEQQGGQPPRS